MYSAALAEDRQNLSFHILWEMAQSEGRIRYSQKNGWWIDFRTVDFYSGKRRVTITRVPGFGRLRSQDECQRALDEIRVRMAHQEPLHEILTWYLAVDAPESLWLTRWNQFCDWKQHKVDTGRLSPRRVQELRRYPGRGYFDSWQQMNIRHVDPAALELWILEMRKRQLSEKTIHHVLGDIAGCLRYMETLGAITKVPTIPWKSLDVEEPDPQIPDTDSVLKVLQAMPIVLSGVFVGRMSMGLRPAEARRLNVTDLRLGKASDLSDGALLVPSSKAKTKTPRLLELQPALRLWLQHPEVVSELGPIESRFGGEALFPNPGSPNRRWTESSERKLWKKAEGLAGVAHIKPNQAGRHYFATLALKDGADIYRLMNWLGHSRIKTTERYAKLAPQTTARMFRRRE